MRLIKVTTLRGETRWFSQQKLCAAWLGDTASQPRVSTAINTRKPYKYCLIEYAEAPENLKQSEIDNLNDKYIGF